MQVEIGELIRNGYLCRVRVQGQGARAEALALPSLQKSAQNPKSINTPLVPPRSEASEAGLCFLGVQGLRAF